MNWLAHVFLSEPEPEFRLGNLLGDIVKGEARAAMSAAFQAGARRHQAIDAYTDSHALVQRSRARLGGDFGHAGGILIDMFYDHFLALDWERYCDQPFERYVASLYAQIRAQPIELPATARAAIELMLREDLLGSYRRIDGIELALARISRRLAARVGREFRLERGTTVLLANFEALRGDFHAFFPQLREHACR